MCRALVKLVCMSAIIASLCPLCDAQQTWLLQGASGKWRSFSRESDWQKEAKESQPLETAVVNRTAANITVVHDVQGESGDWRNIDRYLFRPDGTLISVRRTFASASQDIKLSQVFELDSSGKLRKTFEKEVSLSTGKAKKEALERPEIPIASSTEQLDFMNALKKDSR